MFNTMGERLREAIKHFGFNNTTIAGKLGVSPNYISMIINNKKDLTDSLMMGLTKVIPELNISWLESGEGFIESGQKIETVEESDVGYNLSNGNKISVSEISKLVYDKWEEFMKDRLFASNFYYRATDWMHSEITKDKEDD